MNLIPLVCTKCGATLDFKRSFISKCSSCGTPHALVDSSGNKLLQSVSFLPYVPQGNGKMEKSLMIQLLERIRDAGYIAFTGAQWYAEEYDLMIDDETGKVYNSEFIPDDGSPVHIGVPQIKEVPGDFFSGWQATKLPRVHAFAVISVIPVEADDSGKKMLVGNRINIGVDTPDDEKEGNRLSGLVQEWFGIVPEVHLTNG